MDPPQSSVARTSNIPRLSRIPLLKGPPSSLPTAERVKNTSQSTQQPLKQPSGASPRPGPTAHTHASPPQSPLNGSILIDPTHSASLEIAGQIVPSAVPNTARRKPRPSLSDRTMETLSQIPPSPSPRRRKSSVFSSHSSMVSPVRPTSSLSRSRPSTSHGHRPPMPTTVPTPRPVSPTKRHLAPTSGNQTPQNPSATPTRRTASAHVPQGLPQSRVKAHNVSPISTYKKPSQSIDDSRSTNAIHSKGRPKPMLGPLKGSKTLAARPHQRPSVRGAFDGSDPDIKRVKSIEGRTEDLISEPQSCLPLKPKPMQKSSASFETASSCERPPKSSAALRDTIAKAKAARRQAPKPLEGSSLKGESPLQTGGVVEDGSGSGLLNKRIASARADGRLYIAAMGLTDIPKEVKSMYHSSNFGFDGGAWYESVDLVKLVAADNNITSLDDDLFSNGFEHLQESNDDYQGCLFAGLQIMDLHGNQIHDLPQGLSMLENLTSLNLSNNRIDNKGLGIISQIKSLRELRLRDNALNGELNVQVGNVRTLELLDLSGNAIANLPDSFCNLTALRTLKIDGNRLESLPFSLLSDIPLCDLDVSSNRLRGSLFPPGPDVVFRLRSLDASCNALISLSEGRPVVMPSLHTLKIAENRIKMLPDISEWVCLNTLTAAGNQISSLPVGLTSLRMLKNVDFARNDIRDLDGQIGLMDGLTVFHIANNPLRERRLLTMNTEDLKSELQLRKSTVNQVDGEEPDRITSTAKQTNSRPMPSEAWSVATDGVLKPACGNLHVIESADFETVVQSLTVKSVVLHHNYFQQIPQAVSLVGSTLVHLDLSHNKLINESYLPMALTLHSLKTLDLSANAITSLTPLHQFLLAPKLMELILARNRLSALITLRDSFESLTSVVASNNSISSLDVEAVRGLQVLDVSSNNISHLEPRLGLLGPAGLRTLSVGGNTFRVPKRDIVEKGTESILTWLRTRIPEEEL